MALPLVHVAAVPQGHDGDRQDAVVDGVNDPVVPNPDAKTRPTLQPSHRRRLRSVSTSAIAPWM